MKIVKIALVLGLALASTACTANPRGSDWLSQAPRYAAPAKS